MKRKQLWAALTMMVLLATLPALSLATGTYGSSAVTAGETYTVEQMLTYALQDENLAKAEYDALATAFDNSMPFANIAKAEETHQELLAPLFETYGVTLPENTAASQVTVPATVEEAYAAGVTAETNNIAMYSAFLANKDLPDDVRAVFTRLVNASQMHLRAFTRNAERAGLGMRNGQIGGYGAQRYAQGNGMMGAYGQGNGMMGAYGQGNGSVQNGTDYVTGTCPVCGAQTGGRRW